MTVVDANIVVKWIVQEPGWEQARSLLLSPASFSAPAHVVVETGRALLRHARAGALSAADARLALGGLSVAIELLPVEALIDEAFSIAFLGQVTIYDALYVAAASRQDCEMVTADARLVAGLRGTSGERG